MTWYMTELTTIDESIAADWYVRLFGFEIEFQDVQRSFILLRHGDRRLALKRSTNVDRSTILHFQVDDLEATLARFLSLGVTLSDRVKTSDEGYRRVKLNDPDGRSVVVFAWIQSIPEIGRAER